MGAGGWGPSPSSSPSRLRRASAHLAALTFEHAQDGDIACDDDYRQAFRWAASVHRVGPLLGLRVERGELRVDPVLDDWLLEQARRNRERLANLRRVLDATLAALGREGVAAMPLKGGALLLLAGAPEELAWRPVADVDLLAPDAGERSLDLALADADYCLRGASWKHRIYGPCAPAAALPAGDGEHPGIPFDVEVHAAVVEMFRGLRWDLTPYLLADWVDVGGLRVPHPHATALHLAVHASMSILEGQGRAIQLVDLARALQGVDPQWLLDVVRDAGLRRCARFVYPSVALAARESGDPACAALAAALRWYVPARMVDWLASVSLYDLSWLARDERPPLDRLAIWAHSPVERARMLAHTLLPTPLELAGGDDDMRGPRAIARGYARHYRHLARRAATGMTHLRSD